MHVAGRLCIISIRIGQVKRKAKYIQRIAVCAICSSYDYGYCLTSFAGFDIFQSVSYAVQGWLMSVYVLYVSDRIFVFAFAVDRYNIYWLISYLKHISTTYTLISIIGIKHIWHWKCTPCQKCHLTYVSEYTLTYYIPCDVCSIEDLQHPIVTLRAHSLSAIVQHNDMK